MQIGSHVHEVFIRVGKRATDVTEADIMTIENFVITTHTKWSKISLTDLQIDMFKSLTDNNLRKLAPSRAALEQHTRRACYQNDYV